MITIGDCEICGSRCRAGSTKCYSCEQNERKEDRLSKKTKIVRQVQKVTAKRAGEMQEYYKLRAEYLEAYPCCQVEDCHLKAVDIHHMAGRENGKLTDIKNFMAVCRKHHDHITEHSKEAKESGHSVSRTV